LVISNSRLDEVVYKDERTDIKINEMVSGKSGLIFYKYKEIESFASYAPIPNTNWILVLTVPKSEIFSELETLKFKFLTLTVISVIISIAFGLLILLYNLKIRKISLLKNQIEEDNRLLKENLEMEAIRNQFFANISHEFRTPLNVILGTVQIFELYSAKETMDIVKIRKHIQVMKQNCRRLLRLINNLIDSTRIDAGFLQVNLQNHNIVSIIEEITLSVVEFASARGIELIFDTDTEEEIVACDEDKFERIILNLLSNAIKFTNPGGKIFVNISRKGDTITVSVKDTGIGIPEDEQEVIFERFKQIQQTLSRNNEGSGIGLSLVKSFVELHGGNIIVKSDNSKGSEFIIELPIKLLEDLSRNNNSYLDHDRIEKINIEFSDIYPLC
jgi:signal transduction histidine kinase